MKKIFFVIISFFVCEIVYAQGVDFRKSSFSQILSEAKEQGKMIFVDCYTSWCGPCKYMAKEVFTLKEAGDYFNSRFVNVKFDMEKGEGKELAQKFSVYVYPTFLILRTDGSIQYKIVGGNELEELITKVERGLHKKTTLPYLTER